MAKFFISLVICLTSFLFSIENSPTGIVKSNADDAAYSPLWSVQVYNNSSLGNVTNLATVMSAPIMAMDAVIVNCPIVWVEP